jgi:hypothetical protein
MEIKSFTNLLQVYREFKVKLALDMATSRQSQVTMIFDFRKFRFVFAENAMFSGHISCQHFE